MARRHRRTGRSAPPGGGSVLLSLVDRISAAGMVVVVVVGLALVAIVEQKVLPVGARHRPDAHADPGRASHRPARPSRSAHRRPPMSPATLLSRQVKEVAMAERGTAARRQYRVAKVPTPVVRLSRIDRGRTWAFGTEAIPPPQGMTAVPDSALFLARNTGQGWKVALAGTADFARLLRQAPSPVIGPLERKLLERYNKAVTVTRNTGLMLPWRVGESWSLLATDTGVSGFDGGDGRVLAAGDGRLYRLCSSSPDSGLILVIHPNGLATEYYQLDHVTRWRDGTPVRRGDYLGRTSTAQPCGGGPAPRRMVRFALRGPSGVIPLDHVEIGGWTLHETPTETFAEHDGMRVDAGGLLLNLGVMPSPSPFPSSPGTPAPTRVPKLPLLPSGGVDGRS